MIRTGARTEIDSSLHHKVCCRTEQTYQSEHAGVFCALQRQQQEQISPTHVLLLLSCCLFHLSAVALTEIARKPSVQVESDEHSVPGAPMHHEIFLLQIRPDCLERKPADFKAWLITLQLGQLSFLSS